MPATILVPKAVRLGQSFPVNFTGGPPNGKVTLKARRPTSNIEYEFEIGLDASGNGSTTTVMSAGSEPELEISGGGAKSVTVPTL